MKLNTITVYKKEGKSININESDRDEYIKKGWSEVKPEVRPVTTKPSK